MQTCMANVPNPCMLHAKNMPVTCRDLGRISTRALMRGTTVQTVLNYMQAVHNTDLVTTNTLYPQMKLLAPIYRLSSPCMHLITTHSSVLYTVYYAYMSTEENDTN